jgi:hypothetical protein
MSFGTQTVFTKMVDDFGNQILQNMQLLFFHTSILQYILGICASFFLVKLGLSLKDGRPSPGGFSFVLAWLACLTFNGKPLGFTVINSISTSISYALEKAVNFGMNQATTTGGSGMPPYYAANAFIRAANARITEPNVKTEIASLMQNCVPDPGENIVNNDGLPLSGMDLLMPISTPSNSNVGSYQFNFSSNAQSVLKNRPSHVVQLSTGTEFNCYDLAVQTQVDLRTDMMNQKLTAMPQTIAVGSAPGATKQETFTEPTSVMATNIQTIALNMAAATAATYGAMDAVRDSSVVPFVDEKMLDMSGAVGGFTSLSLGLHNAMDSIAKTYRVFKEWAIGSKLSELNEKLYTLPSLIATAQLWLKILSPIAFVSMFFTGRIVLTWAGMWFATMIFPVIANIFGSYLSALIIARYQFDSAAGHFPTNANFLMTGESLYAIEDVMRDFASHVDTTLNYQMAAFGLVSTLIIGGAWFSHKLANSGLVNTLGMAGRLALGQGIYSGMRALMAPGKKSILEGSSSSSGGISSPSGPTVAGSRASFTRGLSSGGGGGGSGSLPGSSNISPRGPSGSPSSGGGSGGAMESYGRMETSDDFDGRVFVHRPKQITSSLSKSSMPPRKLLPS